MSAMKDMSSQRKKKLAKDEDGTHFTRSGHPTLVLIPFFERCIRSGECDRVGDATWSGWFSDDAFETIKSPALRTSGSSCDSTPGEAGRFDVRDCGGR